MKKIISILLLLASANRGAAQSLDRSVVGSAGGFQAVSWGSLSSSAGEAVVNTLASASNVLTQGFEQPMISDLNVMVYNVAANNTSVQVYPNPASDIINVAINNSSADKHYSVTVYDLPGQRLEVPYENKSDGMQTHILLDIRLLAAATYMLRITDEHNQQIKAVKITKTN